MDKKRNGRPPRFDGEKQYTVGFELRETAWKSVAALAEATGKSPHLILRNLIEGLILDGLQEEQAEILNALQEAQEAHGERESA